MPKEKSIFKSESFFFIVFVLFSAVGVLINLPYCYNYALTYDSSYQYALTLHTWKDIWRLLPEDYSPPLYAMLLKLVCVIFGHTLRVMRFTNSIVIIGLVFLALFPIRKAFGVKASIVSAAGFICSSVNSSLFSEIRPTYLAYFFMTGIAVYAYLAFFEGKNRYYVCHAVFSLLAMYTHNVAMIGALGIYIVLLLFSLIQKDKKKFISFFVSGAICAVLYIPWLLVVFNQLKNVTNHYWAGSYSTLDSLNKDCVESVLYCLYPNSSIPILIEHTLSLISKLLIVFYIIRSTNIKGIKKLSDIIKQCSLFKKERINSYFKLAFILLLLIMPLLIFEMLIRTVYPFTSPRYYYIFTGITIIIMALFFTRLEKRIVPYVFTAFLIINTYAVHDDIRNILKNSNTMQMVETIKKDNPDGNICFLHSHEYSLGIMSYFFPEAKHYIYDDTWIVLNDLSVFTKIPENIGKLDNIKEHTDHFYVFARALKAYENTDLSEYFNDNPDYICDKHRTYNYFYAFPLRITVEKVKVKDAEKTE